MNKKYLDEISEIKERLSEIHADLKRLMEQTNQQHIANLLSTSRKNLINAIIKHVAEDIDEGLENSIVKKCEMRERCKSNFSEFLHKNATLIKHDSIEEETILKKRSELKKMRDNAPFKQCERCFSQVYNIFEKQVNLMRSLQIYSTEEEKKQDLLKLHEDFMVREILEPISSKQRLQILKALAIETKTFSALSEITGLRGGNLLFHLQKLLESGMIIQRHERGDYMITEKGFKILKSISEMYSKL